MRKWLFPLFVTALFLVPRPSYGQWQLIHQFNSQVLTVTFLNAVGTPDVGFVGLSNGENWRTIDRGASWVTIAKSPGTNEFLFIDPLHGWMGPYAGYTSDGGVSWQQGTGIANAIYFNSSNNRLFACGYIQLSFSTDLGLTWQAIDLGINGFSGLCFWDSLHAIVAGYKDDDESVYSTSDGGSTWTNTGSKYECWTPFAVPNSSIGYISYDGSDLIARTSDYGKTWEQYIPRIYAFSSTGTIRGDSCRLYCQTDKGILRSFDGSHSWQNLGGPANKEDTRFCVVGNTIYAGSVDGGLWKYTDNDAPPLSLSGPAQEGKLAASVCDSDRVAIHFANISSCGVVRFESAAWKTHSSPVTLQYVPKLRAFDFGQGDSVVLTLPSGQTGSWTEDLILTFSYNGVKQQRTVSIKSLRAADPKTTLSTTALDFDTVGLCSSALRSFTLRNPGCQPVQVDLGPFPAGYTLDSDSTLDSGSALHLQPGDSVTLHLRYRPVAIGSQTESLPITVHPTTGAAYGWTMILQGVGAAGSSSIALINDTIERWGCGINTDTIYLQNLGCDSLRLDSIRSLPVVFQSNEFAQMSESARTLQGGQVLAIPITVFPASTDRRVALEVYGTRTGAAGFTEQFDTTLHLQIEIDPTKASLVAVEQAISFDTISPCARRTIALHLFNRSCDTIEVDLRQRLDIFNSRNLLFLRENAEDSVLISFIPQGVGVFDDTLEIFVPDFGKGDSVLKIPLHGVATPETSTLAISSQKNLNDTAAFLYHFDDQFAGCTSDSIDFMLQNIGCDKIQIDSIRSSSDQFSAFVLNTNSASQAAINAGDSILLRTKFFAMRTGPDHTTITVFYHDRYLISKAFTYAVSATTHPLPEIKLHIASNLRAAPDTTLEIPVYLVGLLDSTTSGSLTLHHLSLHVLLNTDLLSPDTVLPARNADGSNSIPITVSSIHLNQGAIDVELELPIGLTITDSVEICRLQVHTFVSDSTTTSLTAAASINNSTGLCFDHLQSNTSLFTLEESCSDSEITSAMQGHLLMNKGVYPNPADHSITILLDIPAHEVVPYTIMNVLGQRCRDGFFYTNESSLSLDGLANGKYTIIMNTSWGQVASTIMVQHN